MCILVLYARSLILKKAAVAAAEYVQQAAAAAPNIFYGHPYKYEYDSSIVWPSWQISANISHDIIPVPVFT